MVIEESFPQASISSAVASTILVIDDSEADLKHWADTVSSFSTNYTVLRASDCMTGVKICRDHMVDCVLLDLDMPESGFRGLVELVPSPKHPLIAVIVLTCLVHPALREIAINNGAYSLLIKQHASAEQLQLTIQQAIASIKSARL